MTLLDLAAGEGKEIAGRRDLTLARGGDRSRRGRERTGLGALPGHLQGCLVTTRNSARHRTDRVREGLLPSLEQIDDLVRAGDLPLGPQLLVAGIWGEPCS